MGRLIDADVALQRFIEETEASGKNVIHINTNKRILQDIDTAYNVEKVVEDLQKASTIIEQSENSIKCAIEENMAIHIVKKGGLK